MKVCVATCEPGVARRFVPKLILAGVFAAALLLGFNVYFPALSGWFVFDDFTLPYQRGVVDEPLSAWLATAGVRPFLIFTYWINHAFFGKSPVSYHAFNLLIHILNTVLVFLVLYRLL